jgi:RecA/RadA recombinase
MEQFENVETEWIILSKLLKDVSYLANYGKEVATSSYKKKCYFSDPKYQLLVNLYNLWFTKYGSLPQQKELKSLILRLKEDEDIKLYLISLVDKIEKDTMVYSDKFVREQIELIMYRNKAMEDVLLIQNDLDNGDIEAAREKLKELSNYGRINRETTSKIIISKDFNREEMRAMMEWQKNIPKISSGYPYFDAIINGGFKPAKIYVFAGIAGGGKSILLLQFAINAVKAAKKVLFISYEMDNNVIQTRINLNLLPSSYKNQSAIEFAYIFTPETVLDDLMEARKILEGEMTIIYPELLGQTAHDIEPYLQEKNYDMLVVDYLGIMDSNKKSETNDSPHFKFKAVAEELRSLSKIYEIPIITANQLNADGYKKGVLELTNMAYSNGINHTMDLVAAITPDGYNLQILKSRDGITTTMALDMNKAKYQIVNIREDIGTSKELSEVIKKDEEHSRKWRNE